MHIEGVDSWLSLLKIHNWSFDLHHYSKLNTTEHKTKQAKETKLSCAQRKSKAQVVGHNSEHVESMMVHIFVTHFLY